MKGKGECGAGGAVILNKVSVADTNTDTTAIFTGMYVYGRVCACACVYGCVHVCVGVGSFSCMPSFGCPTLLFNAYSSLDAPPLCISNGPKHVNLSLK